MTQTSPLAVGQDVTTCPHGTISWYVDHDAGVLVIHAELEAHPEDWKAVLPVIGGVMRNPIECSESNLPGIDVYTIKMV